MEEDWTSHCRRAPDEQGLTTSTATQGVKATGVAVLNRAHRFASHVGLQPGMPSLWPAGAMSRQTGLFRMVRLKRCSWVLRNGLNVNMYRLAREGSQDTFQSAIQAMQLPVSCRLIDRVSIVLIAFSWSARSHGKLRVGR